MLNSNILHKNYTLNQNGFQLKLPLNLECIIPENDSVRLLSQFVEAMDLTDLYSTYERIRENHASPRILLKVVLYSYMNGDFSSRSIHTFDIYQDNELFDRSIVTHIFFAVSGFITPLFCSLSK